MTDKTHQNSFLIMLIDDSVMDIYIHKKVVSHFNNNFKIIEFGHAQMAFDYLAENQDKPENLPKIIFLDIYMPYMDGFEFLNAYEKLPQSTRSDIKIFMLSSSLDSSDLKRAAENKNVSSFFQKPLTRQVLEEVSEMAISGVEIK